MRRLHFIIWLFFVSQSVAGQIADTSVKSGTFFYWPDSVVYERQKTTFTPEINRQKSDAFYDSLSIKAKNRQWSSHLHNALIVNTTSANGNGNGKNGFDRTNYFEPFAGKPIRNIYIEQLDVFGPTITDTARQTMHWTGRIGNKLHISTSKQSIKKNLFISENDPIDPYLLADNERILRSKPNLQDARIYVMPIENCPDSVDLRIVTKDVWPIAAGIEIFDIDYGKTGFWNNNFLGIGHNLRFTGIYNLNRDPDMGYKAEYRIPHIGHTFTTLDLKHDDIWNYTANKISLQRNFVTPEIRFGGGLSYENIRQNKDIETIDTILALEPLKYEYYNTWAGYSLPLKRVTDFKLRKSFFLTSRYDKWVFLKRPQTDTFFLHDYHNRYLVLFSTGWAWQGYQSTYLLYGFGDTEDLPYGRMLKFTLGWEESEYNTRLYGGLTFVQSKYLHKIGYLANYLEFGSFYNNKLEQGSLKYSFRYFSPIFGNKRHSFRQFLMAEYEQGYNRFNDEYIDIRFNNGIRGLGYDELKGNKRLLLNTELVYYSPHYIYGFRFLYFLFLDAGMVNYSHNTLIDNPIISSLGIGFRVRNERLVFNTIQFSACIFPFSNRLPNGNKQYLDLTSSQKNRLPEFADKIPSVSQY
ncbi:MAG: hypothetical protein JXB34_05195 [Bacteroidales bacterium]|nr:hypothetical protein [Bacteroidales bacterium]